MRTAARPPPGYNNAMRSCEIYPVPVKNSFGWKWRHRLPDGRLVESKERYSLYYECVSAALASGYQPEVKCLLRGDRQRQTA
jgi:hypothetical protein